MKVTDFMEQLDSDFYAGVPDSVLKPFCDELMRRYGVDGRHHVIAANEGNAVGLAAGYHLATGKAPVVYLQNSGEGNIINPLASLASTEVYGIPMIFVIGWRGEPDTADEPQHSFQGKVTLPFLDVMDVPYAVVDKETTAEQMRETAGVFRSELARGRQAAFVVRKGALDGKTAPTKYENGYPLLREDVLKEIAAAAGNDIIVSTTGKTSRELFEIREAGGQGHERDFLVVGSMGHASSVALSIALQRPARRVWCIDGDGAALMHMGAMAVIGQQHPGNLIHVIINNGAHESVGGLPTAAKDADFALAAKEFGYPHSVRVSERYFLRMALDTLKNERRLSMLEVKCGIGSREDLGRPDISLPEQKEAFMRCVREE